MNRYIFIWIVLLISGCAGNQKQDNISLEMKNFYGKKISFTDNLFSNDKKDSILQQAPFISPYKIVVYVDSANCTPCALEKMTLWNKYAKKLKEWDITLLLILKNSNKDEVHFILNELQITTPVFFDTQGVFEKTNQLPTTPQLKTFLLNQDNQVIFIGAPIQNEKTWILFEKTMNQLISNNNQLPGLNK